MITEICHGEEDYSKSFHYIVPALYDTVIHCFTVCCTINTHHSIFPVLVPSCFSNIECLPHISGNISGGGQGICIHVTYICDGAVVQSTVNVEPHLLFLSLVGVVIHQRNQIL